MIKTVLLNEKIINEGLRVALREKDATRSLELFLEHIGRESGCERIYIFEEGKENCISNTFEWCAEGVSSEKDNLQNVPFKAVEWWYHAFEEKSSLIIKDIEDIKESEPLTYQYLKPQHIHSLIASPLVLEDKIIGFYGVDNPPPEIMTEMHNIAEIVGHFIVSLLEKQRLMKQLEKFSFEDSLSGLQNRHALSQYINSCQELAEVGVAYCDLLGLKRVNDKLGHQAGDDLIIRASSCLKDNFPEKALYRIGGDEFLVICREPEEAFTSRVEKLKRDMHEKDVRMSIGCVWRQKLTDLDALIAEADDLMYQDKRAYYASC